MSQLTAHLPQTLLFALAFSTFFSHTPSFAAPPPGQSALLNGMHDIQSSAWMTNATPGCDKGWLTDLRYIDYKGNPGIDCHTNETKAGLSIIQRLDVSGSESYPRSTNNANGFANNFALYAKQCSNIHVWIVGNEPNFTEHKSDPDCTSAAYATAYVAVHKAIHALPGHQNDVVLVASNSPYSPGCVESLRQIIKQIQQRGIQPDGFALHAYTRAAKGSDLTAGHVTSTQTQRDQTRKECAGSATWDDTWHSHFRIYIDYIAAIEALGLAGRAVYITESGNACEPTIANNACYPDADVGYFQALYAEANRWNQLPSTRTQIRAITPYRWTLNQDGTSRDFAIGQRPKLLQDLSKAFAKQYRWTSDKCAPSGCKQDSDCQPNERCDPQGKCEPRPPQICQQSGDCPGQLCSPTSCQDRSGQCIPKGDATFVITPPTPTPGTASLQVIAQHPTGWTHIGLRYCGPSQGDGTFVKNEKIGGKHNWTFTMGPVQAGRYRIDFTADKGATIVGSTELIVASPCAPVAETCNNKDDDCDGQIDNGITRPCYEGPAGTEGQGICQSGIASCQAGQWGPCIGQIIPTQERCDGQDNDCNGLIDDPCQPSQEANPPDSPHESTGPPDTRPTDRQGPDVQEPEIPVLNPDPGSSTPRRGCSCASAPGPLTSLLMLWSFLWSFLWLGRPRR